MVTEITLPNPPKPLGLYEPVGRIENILYSCGTTARDPRYKGRLGENVTTSLGTEAARKCALNVISILKEALEDLSKIEQLVKMNVYVATVNTWEEHSKLADGASAVFHELLGERGRHARTTIGVSCLPGGTCVEIEVVVKISEMKKG